MNKWIRLATVSFGGIVFSIIALIIIQSMAGLTSSQDAHGSNAHQSDPTQQQVSYAPGHTTGTPQNYGYPILYGQQAPAYMNYNNPYPGYVPGNTAGVSQNYGYPALYGQQGVANSNYGNLYPGYSGSYYPTGAYGNMPQDYQLQQQQQLLQLKQQLLEMKYQLNNMMMNQGNTSGSSMMPM